VRGTTLAGGRFGIDANKLLERWRFSGKLSEKSASLITDPGSNPLRIWPLQPDSHQPQTQGQRFKKCVTAEVLPSIRKPGGYAAVAHICLLKGRGSLIR
jgi:hypothetical protein